MKPGFFFIKQAAAAFIVLGLTGCASGPIREVISTKEAPAAIGPYSQAIKFGNMLFLSGQIPLDPGSGLLNGGSIEEQTTLVIENLKAVLAANDMVLKDVVSMSVFLKDMNDFAKMNAVYGAYFSDKPPARTTAEAARLPRDVLVEISAIAAKQK